MKKIIFYETITGECPVEEFLESLSSKQAQKVAWVLELIEELPMISTKYLKKLVNTNDIWEVRIRYSSDIFRLLGFLDGSNFIVLNHAFQKKTQKIPRKAIQIAEKRKKDYFKRENP
ncbi:MAG: type II toxin-antitoxin system RelE/ParE family toxin [Candidatus Marinimicrobia bacterium]|jgi:phage-related protein|nr:type II toxin-antitoxin system RelE/ParE family toxin [Nitrosomonadales bacterium]MBT6671971.1 type II toxin-antitoxin system RelE/ParE family toxin [Lentimicrobiaceae bacterium]MBT7195478.1 type II toxin-antitoxin system RelE/ParE family toxin [Candidatus Neomarinimicrobiota bacterium]